ncbi:MAG TPA: potassium transporter TrkG [Gaiellaceae bacterium]|nr:potassium transporter TrkG [Gaiellaceae bacterium]
MRRRSLHPAQLVVLAFATAILVGTLLLLLPVARVGDEGASFLTALFTATSAVCVTGLVVVDTETYWSPTGQVVIMALIQVGGFGIMALTSLLALLVARRLGLRTRLLAQTETKALQLGDVRRVLLGVAILSLLFETATMLVLTGRLWLAYDYGLGDALWHGAFHAVSAFNNAGFSLWSDSLMGFVTDGWISLAVAGAVICGGLGFPVWIEIVRRGFTWERWSIHTKLTLAVTAVLLVAGTAAVLAFEWSQPETLGPLGVGGKLLAGFFQGVMPRTAGFNSLDYGELQPETLLLTEILMFVGGGSASTAGGIKVTTLALLALMVVAEVRGDPSVHAFGRRIPAVAQRQAFSIAVIALVAVVTGTLVLMASGSHAFGATLFEAVSAFGTVGLSTGITADLSGIGKVALIALMFLGRTGPYTLFIALVLRERRRRFEYPEERPIIG